MDKLEEMFRFELHSSVEAGKRIQQSEEHWAQVRRWEAQLGRPFGEIVHELRLSVDPAEIPERLGVSKSFLYQHFGWAMNKIAYVERMYGLPLGEVVRRRRQEGESMAAMAQEWGLAVNTLYNALGRLERVSVQVGYGGAGQRAHSAGA